MKVISDKIAKELLLIARELTSGLIQPPPKMVRDISNWINSSVAHTVMRKYNWFVKDYEKHGDDMDNRMYGYSDWQIETFRKNIEEWAEENVGFNEIKTWY